MAGFSPGHHLLKAPWLLNSPQAMDQAYAHGPLGTLFTFELKHEENAYGSKGKKAGYSVAHSPSISALTPHPATPPLPP